MTDNMTEQQAYQYALDVFNQTVANMSTMADSARADAMQDLSNMQASYNDPGAYNLTMYGMNQVSGIQDHVMNTVGNVSNYYADNSSVTSLLTTEHTSVASGTTASGAIDSIGSLFSHAVSDPGTFVHTNSTGFMVLGIIFSVLLLKFIFLRR